MNIINIYANEMEESFSHDPLRARKFQLLTCGLFRYMFEKLNKERGGDDANMSNQDDLADYFLTPMK